VLEEQIRNLEREKNRVEKLLADDAATPKQLDDLSGQLDVLEQQIKTAREQARLANKALMSEKDPLGAQRRVLDDQIRKCYVYNPEPGTVLTKYAELHEVVRFGSPLYKLANLDYLTLRAYISGDQLGSLKIGQEVSVLVDAPGGEKRSLKGNISWVADEAEFTPKTIQTREERISLVYAVKVRVPNDGSLKIGMPGELWLADPQAEESVSASTNK
jgi:HlyD family secretion protein